MTPPKRWTAPEKDDGSLDGTSSSGRADFRGSTRSIRVAITPSLRARCRMDNLRYPGHRSVAPPQGTVRDILFSRPRRHGKHSKVNGDHRHGDLSSYRSFRVTRLAYSTAWLFHNVACSQPNMILPSTSTTPASTTDPAPRATAKFVCGCFGRHYQVDRYGRSRHGAVPALLLARFHVPPAEPDVRVFPHPALHSFSLVTPRCCSKVWGFSCLGTLQVRRRHSSQPPEPTWRIRSARPDSPILMTVPCTTTRPTSTRFEPVRRLRGFTPLVSLIHLSVSLAGHQTIWQY
jgi:hypothetical protein